MIMPNHVCHNPNVFQIMEIIVPSPHVPLSSIQRPLRRSTKQFPSRAGKIQPGPDPHLDQLESICYCKYKFCNV